MLLFSYARSTMLYTVRVNTKSLSNTLESEYRPNVKCQYRVLAHSRNWLLQNHLQFETCSRFNDRQPHTHNLNSDDEHVGSVGLHISLATHPSIQISSVPPPVFTIRFEMILSIHTAIPPQKKINSFL